MTLAPHLAAIAQRDQFLRRVADTRRVYVVSGEDGLARVPARRQRGREVTLIWSRREEAERWADVVTTSPRVKELVLGELLAEVLPGLARLKRFVGVDWTAEGSEPEFDAGDLAERILLEGLEVFLHRVRVTGRVWTLEDVSGPALLVSHVRPNQYVLPCWAERDEAEARIEGPWRDMFVIDIPLPDFLDRKLVWLHENGHLVAPGYAGGGGFLELEPREFNARFAQPAQA